MIAGAVFSPPEQGQLVSVRTRNWIVNEVSPSTLLANGLNGISDSQTLISLASVDDDGLGEEIEVVWELEPGTRIKDDVALPGADRLRPDRPPRCCAPGICSFQLLIETRTSSERCQKHSRQARSSAFASGNTSSRRSFRLAPGTTATLVRLSCLDDDAQGQPLEVLWEKEVDSEIDHRRGLAGDREPGIRPAEAVLGLPAHLCSGTA